MFEVEWEESYLGDISMFLSHANYTYSDLNSAGKIGYLHYGFIHSSEYQKLNVAKLPKISKDQAKNYDCLKDGDIVVADVSEDKDGIGKYVSVDNCEQHPVISGLHTIAIRPDQKYINPVFSPYLLSQSNIHVNLCAKAVGTKVYSISKDNLASLKIKIPSLDEQAAIASALSDIDSLISSLEQLIAKKRLIKQGVMQELLTGKKRLSGFNDDWVEKRVCEMGMFIKGKGVTKEESKSGFIPCIRYGEIYTDHDDIIRNFHSFISRDAANTAVLIKSGDILFTCSGETKEEIGKSVAFIDNIEAYAGGDIHILRNASENTKFLGYRLNAKDISVQKSNVGQGDSIVHISSIALGNIIVYLPKDLKEQAVIASVLSDIDDEIEVLEAKLEKTRQIRAGMMEELLTGRIRLVEQ